MINLRKYQQEAVDCIHETFKKENRQYIEMPTGSGKTVTFLSYAKKYHDRILIIVPSVQLMNQIYESALCFFRKEEISRKGARFDEEVANIHICIINSIRNVYSEFLCEIGFDLIIIDEAHHTYSNMYLDFIKNTTCFFNEDEIKILGVTATPERLDKLLIEDVLHTCSYKLDLLTLIQNKHLCDIKGLRLKTNLSLMDVDSKNGDFCLHQLFKKINTESRNQMILDTYKREMTGRKVLIFAVNVEHSQLLNKLFCDHGIASLHIDGKMKPDQRQSILTSFRNGETSVLFNCQLLTEGFDEPSIDGIILARPTRSRSLFIQMIGRGLRSFPGKENCKIIDIADNHKFLSSFNSIITDKFFNECGSFKKIDDLKNHISKETLKVTEFEIERISLFDSSKPIEKIKATDSMLNYLEKNNIEHHEPISFNEASFLIWYNETKKRLL